MKNALKSLAKSGLIQLGLTAAASATDEAIPEKMFWSGRPLDLALRMTTLITSNEQINDIMKIVESLEEFRFMVEGISETIKTKAKLQEGGFLSMLLGILGASLLWNLFTGKEVMRAGEGTNRNFQEF